MPNTVITDRMTAAERDALPPSAFLLPTERLLPVQDRDHWQASGERISGLLGVTDSTRAKLTRKWEQVGVDKGWLTAADVTDQALTDEFDAELEVIEDAAGGRLRLRVMLTRANVRNRNRRVYPRDVLADMVERGKRRLKERTVTMQWPHPAPMLDSRGRVIGWQEDPTRDVSIIDDVFMRGDRVYVDTTFLDTDMGKALAARYRAGAKLAVSLRAAGRTKRAVMDGEDTQVATFLDWWGGDWVPDPALPEAGPEAVLTDSQIAAVMSTEDEQVTPKELQALKDELTSITDGLATETDANKVAELKGRLASVGATIERHRADEAKEHDALAGEVRKEITDMSSTVGSLQATVDGLTKTLEGLRASNEAVEKERAANANRQAVTAFVDSLKDKEDLKRFPDAIRDSIRETVGKALTVEDAEKALTDAVESFDKALAVAKLAQTGYQQNAAAGTVNGRTVEVVSNPKPWKTVLDNFGEAYRDHARLSNSPMPDPSLVKQNQPFIDEMMKQIEKQHGGALTDSANMLLDEKAYAALTDAANPTNTSMLWNQPTILTALMVQQFQFLEALQFVQGIGPMGFTQQDMGQGNIGSVLRIPVEYFEAPAGALDLPPFSDNMAVLESGAIPELNIRTNWLSFAPAWKRAAFTLTADAEKALAHGPLNYQAWARLTYNLTQYKARTIDRMLYEEMLLVASEYGAVAVTNESVAAPEWTYNAGGSAGGYGPTVVGVAQLLCGGATTAPNTDVPVVRTRPGSTDLSAAGQPTATAAKNPITSTVSGNPQVLGYLNSAGDIASFPGTTATFAIDYINGKAVFNAASGVGATTRPVMTAYSYETNFDSFNLTNPTLATAEYEAVYLNKLLKQIDATNATMASFPRFVAADTAIMSFGSATAVQNAAMWYQWVSPEGSRLTNPRIGSNAKFGERSGVEMCKINTPWTAGDRRILMLKNGSTKYGIDTPFEIQGPYPSYDVTTGQLKDEKKAYGRENSVICTPQVTNQGGTVLNPVSRTIILR